MEPLPAMLPFAYGSPKCHVYLRAVDEFVVQWGLDRLEGPPGGGDYVNDWVMLRQRFPETTPSEFSTSRGWGEPPRHLPTLVRIELSDDWSPRNESVRHAQRRLEEIASAAIRRQLEAIAAEAEAAGFSFHDTAPYRERDLDWIFELCTRGISVRELAEAHRESEDAVGQAVKRMANRLRIRRAGWFATNRTTRARR